SLCERLKSLTRLSKTLALCGVRACHTRRSVAADTLKCAVMATAADAHAIARAGLALRAYLVRFIARSTQNWKLGFRSLAADDVRQRPARADTHCPPERTVPRVEIKIGNSGPPDKGDVGR